MTSCRSPLSMTALSGTAMTPAGLPVSI